MSQLKLSRVASLTRARILPIYSSDSACEVVIGTPQAGDRYFNSVTNKVRYYNGTYWKTTEYTGLVAGYTRTSISTFTVTDNTTNQSIYKAGLPLKYRTASGSGTFYYGIIKGYSSGTITIMGAPLPTTVGEMHVGPDYKVVFAAIQITGSLTTGDDKLKTVMKSGFRWNQSEAYIVAV